MVGITNQNFKHKRIAIEGFGKVGSSLAAMLSRMGATLIAVSTEEGAIVQTSGLDLKLLLSLKEQYGNGLVHHYPDVESVRPSELFIQPVDLLVPGARPYAINMDNVDTIDAKWIVPISNIPITREGESTIVRISNLKVDKLIVLEKM